jgi:Subtilase family
MIAASCCALLAGCSGGGSTGTLPATVSAPTPVPVPVATATPAPGVACSSVSRSGLAGRRLARAVGTPSSWIAPNRLYVTYRTAAGASAARAIDGVVRSARSTDLGTNGSLAHRLVTVPAGSTAATATSALRATAGVVDVQPLHLRRPSADAVANDPLLDDADQWYLYKTNTDAGAWSATHGSSAVSVAIVDTGVDETNRDFTFAVRESVVDGVKTTGAGTAQDTNGHGTNVAGLATAAANDGYGFAGAGYATPVQAYRIFPDATATSDCQTADTGDEAVAIRDAVANGASVINLSLGSPQSAGADQAEQDAIAYAIANNVTVVAAAGNEYGTSDGGVVDYPAAYPGVIAVGASAVQDATPGSYTSITVETVASYSNSGATLVAPGGDATSDEDDDVLHWIENYSTTTAAYAPDQCTNGGGVCRAYFNGTSQATPQVAGTVALMEAYHGGARSLSPSQVSAILQQTADPITGISSTRQGAGRLDAAKAVAAAHP